MGCLEIDEAREAGFRAELEEHLRASGQSNVEANVENLMSRSGGMRGRLEFFLDRAPDTPRERLLVSGCSAGTAVLLGRLLGFREVHGSEVDRALLSFASRRIEGTPGAHVSLLAAGPLPYRDAAFSAVLSSHVIEHTPDPALYLLEHMRVLAPGGRLFLEFPNRYFHTELHTGLPSVEWLPPFLRELALRSLASRFSPVRTPRRRYYHEVRRDLTPISSGILRRILRRMEGAEILDIQRPAPGYRRLVLGMGPGR